MGPQWQRQRKVSVPGFRPRWIYEAIKNFVVGTERLMSSWRVPQSPFTSMATSGKAGSKFYQEGECY